MRPGADERARRVGLPHVFAKDRRRERAHCRAVDLHDHAIRPEWSGAPFAVKSERVGAVAADGDGLRNGIAIALEERAARAVRRGRVEPRAAIGRDAGAARERPRRAGRLVLKGAVRERIVRLEAEVRDVHRRPRIEPQHAAADRRRAAIRVRSAQDERAVRDAHAFCAGDVSAHRHGARAHFREVAVERERRRDRVRAARVRLHHRDARVVRLERQRVRTGDRVGTGAEELHMARGRRAVERHARRAGLRAERGIRARRIRHRAAAPVACGVPRVAGIRRPGIRENLLVAESVKVPGVARILRGKIERRRTGARDKSVAQQISRRGVFIEHRRGRGRTDRGHASARPTEGGVVKSGDVGLPRRQSRDVEGRRIPAELKLAHQPRDAAAHTGRESAERTARAIQLPARARHRRDAADERRAIHRHAAADDIGERRVSLPAAHPRIRIARESAAGKNRVRRRSERRGEADEDGNAAGEDWDE